MIPNLVEEWSPDRTKRIMAGLSNSDPVLYEFKRVKASDMSMADVEMDIEHNKNDICGVVCGKYVDNERRCVFISWKCYASDKGARAEMEMDSGRKRYLSFEHEERYRPDGDVDIKPLGVAICAKPRRPGSSIVDEEYAHSIINSNENKIVGIKASSPDKEIQPIATVVISATDNMSIDNNASSPPPTSSSTPSIPSQTQTQPHQQQQQKEIEALSDLDKIISQSGRNSKPKKQTHPPSSISPTVTSNPMSVPVSSQPSTPPPSKASPPQQQQQQQSSSVPDKPEQSEKPVSSVDSHEREQQEENMTQSTENPEDPPFEALASGKIMSYKQKEDLTDYITRLHDQVEKQNKEIEELKKSHGLKESNPKQPDQRLNNPNSKVDRLKEKVKALKNKLGKSVIGANTSYHHSVTEMETKETKEPKSKKRNLSESRQIETVSINPNSSALAQIITGSFAKESRHIQASYEENDEPVRVPKDVVLPILFNKTLTQIKGSSDTKGVRVTHASKLPINLLRICASFLPSSTGDIQEQIFTQHFGGMPDAKKLEEYTARLDKIESDFKTMVYTDKGEI